MTHVVTDACIRCKYTDGVDVFPVDCFAEGPRNLFIDPDGCTDCAVRMSECPANAIYAEDDLPKGMKFLLPFNKNWLLACPPSLKECPPFQMRNNGGL